jgi:hypothetical protein
MKMTTCEMGMHTCTNEKIEIKSFLSIIKEIEYFAMRGHV